MREFYVYGLKSREEYDKKSARSYDDERRRLESWLGDHMGFVRTAEGKSVFISIDSRSSFRNPLYKAWKSKSFTDGDITLHFILMDLLQDGQPHLLAQLMEGVDARLAEFEDPMVFDESTVRKKLKEYCALGLVESTRSGKRSLYRKTELWLEEESWRDAVHFFSEVAPCGVIGSFIEDRWVKKGAHFGFKHHYITSAMDSDVLALLFLAMQKHCAVTVTCDSRHLRTQERLVPLRVLIGVQNGRQHLVAYHTKTDSFRAYRIDYLSEVVLEQTVPRFEELRAELAALRPGMWGVSMPKDRYDRQSTERVEMILRVEQGEEHIVSRLEREKRVGLVERLDQHRYRFTAEVYDAGEMIPWLRTFICRIEDIRFSNSLTERRFKKDIEQMYRLYGIGGEQEDARKEAERDI
ncbi:MAG: WYL domain-containing protein [Clostridia bacterium]|nr:WYL domain-containing protein [Clostridia bacterium]